MVRITEGTASLAVGEGPIFVLSFVLISVAMLAVFGTIPRMRNPEEEQLPEGEQRSKVFICFKGCVPNLGALFCSSNSNLPCWQILLILTSFVCVNLFRRDEASHPFQRKYASSSYQLPDAPP